jgi:hypothetical protein
MEQNIKFAKITKIVVDLVEMTNYNQVISWLNAPIIKKERRKKVEK